MVNPCRPLRPSRRGLSDAVIDPIEGPALVLRPRHCGVPMQATERSAVVHTSCSLIGLVSGPLCSAKPHKEDL